MRRALIVTADDVGMHRSMTDGAIEGHRRGIVTSCSIVAGGVDFERAADCLRALPGLATGVHLALVEGRPVSDRAAVPSLVDSAGRFRGSFRSFTAAALAGRIRWAEVELELRAQIERVLASGLTIAHLNGHQHLHLLPPVSGMVFDLAAAYGIGFVRVADDRGGEAPLMRRLSVAALNQVARRATRGLQSPAARSDRTIGIAGAGRLDARHLLALMGSVEGLTELVTHPGTDDRELEAAYHWGYHWEEELAALCDPAVRQAIAGAGIELVSTAALGTK